MPNPLIQNRFIATLPTDRSLQPGSRQLHGVVAALAKPTPVAAPQMLAWSDDVAAQLGLARDDATWAPVLAGNQLLDGMEPYSACYGGHQFGNWAGQLGDGRAITLGEFVGPGGTLEVQLKGAGPTPFSRNSDGRAVLRSSLREFVCSEAMHALGIATTRALALVATGDPVLRDMLYNGNAKLEPGAITTRVAPSFLRFGNYELLAARGDTALLRQLVDYTLRTHFWPPAAGAGTYQPGDYLRFFQHVCLRTAAMVVDWMRVGFVHGVMNTDNMSILGLTIDYGPYGWLEPYDPRWTPNTTDAHGKRYAFGAQPMIAQWNVAQLGRALRALIDDDTAIAQTVEMFGREYQLGFRKMMLAKLGVTAPANAADQLLGALFDLFAQTEVDYTLFFRLLGEAATVPDANQACDMILAAFYDAAVPPAVVSQLREFVGELAPHVDAPSGRARQAAMHAVNPLYVPRNYLAQLAIDDATQGKLGYLTDWLAVLRTPYVEQVATPDAARFAGKRPEWARQRVGCSMLSCSS